MISVFPAFLHFPADTVQSCVAKLFFSCPLKGHYCLYSKSSFTLVSQQPPLWIHIMFLFQQVRPHNLWAAPVAPGLEF